MATPRTSESGSSGTLLDRMIAPPQLPEKCHLSVTCEESVGTERARIYFSTLPQPEHVMVCPTCAAWARDTDAETQGERLNFVDNKGRYVQVRVGLPAASARRAAATYHVVEAWTPDRIADALLVAGARPEGFNFRDLRDSAGLPINAVRILENLEREGLLLRDPPGATIAVATFNYPD